MTTTVYHHCHARQCEVPTPRRMLMCKRHWSMVPKKLQAAVWETFREGQGTYSRPSKAWHAAADAAITYVAQKENAMQTGVR